MSMSNETSSPNWVRALEFIFNIDYVSLNVEKFFDVILKSAKQYLYRKIVAQKLTKWHQNYFHDLKCYEDKNIMSWNCSQWAYFEV